MHKCQGFGQLLALPGPPPSSISSPTPRRPAGQREGRDVAARRSRPDFSALAPFAGATPPPALVSRARRDRRRRCRAADERLRADGPDAAGAAAATGLLKARALRDALPTLGLDDERGLRDSLRLAQTIEKFEEALVLAHGLRFEALADDGVVTPGQPIS